jgi:hypothetical protein
MYEKPYRLELEKRVDVNNWNNTGGLKCMTFNAQEWKQIT